MKKNILISSLAVLVITVSSYSNVSADEIESETAEGTVGAYGTVNPGGNVTSSFSSIMLDNAARVYQYKITDKTYPIGTGLYFAKKVKSRGPWDYKHAYGATDRYIFGGRSMRGEDLGNMHYGYVGRFAGFSATLLKSTAGAVQIYSGTSQGKWYGSYFDDPSDQTSIVRGISYYDNKNLPTKSSGVQNLMSGNSSSNSLKSFSFNNLSDNDTNVEQPAFPEGMTEDQFLNRLSVTERTKIIEEAEETAEVILEDPTYQDQLENFGIENN